MKWLHQPVNEVELMIIRSFFDSENMPYFVRNDHFGSLKIGPMIDLLNVKTILVPDEQFDRAQELLSHVLDNLRADDGSVDLVGYSVFDKVRMIAETMLFFWFLPGVPRRKGDRNEFFEDNHDAVGKGL